VKVRVALELMSGRSWGGGFSGLVLCMCTSSQV